MIYKDILKDTIRSKLEKVLDIPIKNTALEESTTTRDYPRMIFVELIDDLSIRVIDYDSFDKMGVEKPPKLGDIVGLYICNTTSKSLINNYDEVTGIVSVDAKLTPMVENMDELIIESEIENNDIGDYVYITSLHNFNNRKSANLVEIFRRFEIG
ncbi:MAG: hypothetical protein ACRC5T_10845, partial [Cetobacterium sp.]